MAAENRTKSDLDRALRRILEDKPLDQIRVRELTALCGIRRQSFYYHFPDVYTLLDWSLCREGARLLSRQERCLTWQQALTDLLAHVARHRRYYQALLDHRGRDGLRELLTEPLESLLSKTLGYYQLRCGAQAAPDPALLSCWKTLLLSLLESLVQGELAQPPEALISQLEAMVHQGAMGAAWWHLAAGAR